MVQKEIVEFIIKPPDYFSCTNDVDVVTFQQLFNLRSISERTSFAIVLPDGIDGKIIKTDFCPLILMLKSKKNLTVAAGKRIFSWKPVCTLIREDWTIKMSNNYSNFVDGSSFIDDEVVGKCFSCDLLPDIFVVNLQHLRIYYKKLYDMGPTTISSHLPFFMLMKNRSAYCSEYVIPTLLNDTNYKTFDDFSCNNLASRWDERFSLVQNLTGIYRIITPNEQEAWLNCVWTKSSFNLDLPIHCSNFVRQYLYDIVDILVHRMKVDYRIVYGTLLGALREHDIIPWTVDADIYPLMSDDEFGEFYENVWSRLSKISGRRYSKIGIDYGDHLDETLEAIRAFPMCPIILTSRRDTKYSHLNKTRNVLIEKEILLSNSISLPSDHDDWRQMGYVDVYSTMHLTECVKKHLKDKSEWVYIRHKKFKTFGNPLDVTLCQYGNDSLVTFPNTTNLVWNTFIEELT